MKDAVIVGAGLAGLNCALTLQQSGFDVSLLEAADAAGGRLRTDVVEGFRLDRGFQVILTAYPEARRVLDYDSLNLKALKPGALVRHGGRFHQFADPYRDLLGALRMLFDPVVSFSDKLAVLRLRGEVRKGTEAELFSRPERTTRAYLQDFGFSSEMIERFFEPFFGGVFLERELTTSSRFFEFLFRMFSMGDTAVPEQGMEEIPRQMAARLKEGTLSTGAHVRSIAATQGGYAVEVQGRDRVVTRRVVLALPDDAWRTLVEPMMGKKGANHRGARRWNRTTTFYYAAERAPVNVPIILLNGEGPQAGPVNNVAVMSRVSAAYAPAGAELIAVSVVGEAPQSDDGMEKLEADVRAHLEHWFPGEVRSWRVIGGYPIEHALPLQSTADWERSKPALPMRGESTADAKIFVCGDQSETASIQGALVSGRRAAEAAVASLKR